MSYLAGLRERPAHLHPQSVYCGYCRCWTLPGHDGTCLWCIDSRRTPKMGRPRSFDWAYARRLHNGGMTLEETAAACGVTRYAVCRAFALMRREAA